MNAVIEVGAFGLPLVKIGGKLVHWEPLPLQLFMFLVDKEAATRDMIFEAIWPALGVKAATNVFHVTKRKVELTLREAAGHELPDLIEYDQGWYWLPDWSALPKPIVRDIKVRYNVRKFEEDLIQYREDASTPLEDWQELLSLVETGEFLPLFNSEWVIDRRVELKRLSAEAYVHAAHAARKKRNLTLEMQWLERAYQQHPAREDVHRELLRCYAQVSSQTVHSFYREIKGVLAPQSPSKETRKLYTTLTKE